MCYTCYIHIHRNKRKIIIMIIVMEHIHIQKEIFIIEYIDVKKFDIKGILTIKYNQNYFYIAFRKMSSSRETIFENPKKI